MIAESTHCTPHWQQVQPSERRRKHGEVKGKKRQEAQRTMDWTRACLGKVWGWGGWRRRRRRGEVLNGW